MSKEFGVIILGLFVAVLPILGFPQAWRDIFFALAGLGVAVIGFFLRADHLRREASRAHERGRKPERYTFVENGGAGKMEDVSAAPAVHEGFTQPQ